MNQPLKFKKLHPEAVIPKRATPYDAGVDIVATSVTVDGDVVTYGTGLAVEIPEGYFGMCVPRSSIYKYDLILSNSCGILDSKYRNEFMFKFRLTKGMESYSYEVGDRIGQLVIVPYKALNPIEVEELDMNNDRGGGFGSTNG